jgi:hypothetical protein
LIYLSFFFSFFCFKQFSLMTIKEKDFWYLLISMTVISIYIWVIIIIMVEREK